VTDEGFIPILAAPTGKKRSRVQAIKIDANRTVLGFMDHSLLEENYEDGMRMLGERPELAIPQ
jgi:hypothetical protein